MFWFYLKIFQLVFSKLHSSCPEEHLKQKNEKILWIDNFFEVWAKILGWVVITSLCVSGGTIWANEKCSKISQLTQPELEIITGEKSLHTERMIFLLVIYFTRECINIETLSKIRVAGGGVRKEKLLGGWGKKNCSRLFHAGFIVLHLPQYFFNLKPLITHITIQVSQILIFQGVACSVELFEFDKFRIFCEIKQAKSAPPGRLKIFIGR